MVGVGTMGQHHVRNHFSNRRSLLERAVRPGCLPCGRNMFQAWCWRTIPLTSFGQKRCGVYCSANVSAPGFGLKCIERGLHVLMEKPVADPCLEQPAC